MRVITLSEAIEVIKAIADENPDFSFEGDNFPDGCSYNDNGQPACIVGHWMVREGITLPDMNTSLNSAVISGRFMSNFLEAQNVRLNYDAKHFLQEVQFKQDGGETWGDAVEAALFQFGNHS